MLDVQKLLGQFLGMGTARDGRGRTGSGSGLGGGVSGGQIQDMIAELVRTHGSSALSGGLAGGLASQLFRGRSLGGTALKLGGAALVAGLAYKAYQDYQAKNGGGAASFGSGAGVTPGGGGSPSGARYEAHLPDDSDDARARLMLSAMIAAAKADGYIDAGEQAAIFDRIDALDLDPEEKGFVVDEMRRPLTVDDLVERARSPQTALEIYTASVLAIDPDHPAERAYLDILAARLNLPPELVAEVRRTTDAVAK